MRQIHHRSAAMAARTQLSNRLIRIDHGLWMRNRFEPRLHLADRAGNRDYPPDDSPLSHPPPACAARSPPSRRIPESATAAAGKPLPQSHFQSDNAAKTDARREKSSRPGSRAKRYPAVSSMTLQAEIVLPCRVFDFFGQKDRMANFIFAQDSSRRSVRPVRAQACSCPCREVQPSEQS